MAPLAKLAVLGLAAAPALAAPTTKPFPAGTEVRSEDGTSTIQIVGGTAASAGDFPFIVSLSQGGSHFCGGVLLDATHVVTAAHCSVGQSASSVKVRAGSLNWSSGGTQVSVSKITVHPSYQASTTNNDVAVWKLSSSIAASGNIGYATLPAQGSDPSAGTNVLVGGWGTTSEGSGSIPSALRKVTVPVVSRATCRAAYDSSSITDNMWCAGLAQGGKDSCQGDSGGPIVDASTKVLQGVVSWGEGCARANAYGVYTRIGNYVTWIKNNLN